MPGDQMLGLTKATAFSDASNSQGIETDNLNTRVNAFLTDMEPVKDALWGNAQVRFNEAITQFLVGYNQLQKKLGRKAIALGEGNNYTVQTDQLMEGEIGTVGKSIPANITA
ncbi:hypothetical protein Afil01_13020 [Actinorhabdospora filicis]|uniref:Uncharacterized protein n=1 Tax=Actinorhabdospora filicis TaxID=1785913 RepID=A0A9W6SG23_9ACTN|nr:hypothetical protein [Actinorhabdospora filicis]GLZ76495.1 hypothetical protein Afil01_13020 [Actinorhabdospora filicis]